MENIIISDKENLEKKKEDFRKEGKDKIHVVTDFDRTLTKDFVDGMKSSTSWAQFRNQHIFDEDYYKKAHEMFDYYRPFEVSRIMSFEEKNKKMKEWWEKHLSLLVEKGITKQIIKEVVERGRIILRKGAKKFLKNMYEKGIPVVIISSGIGNMITEVLRKEECFYDNIQIISNFFKWDENDKGIDFQRKPIIHSLNKHEVAVKNSPGYEKIKNRRNVLLLGDNIDDLKMVESFDYSNLICFGFLNEKIEEDIEGFKNNFDVVLLNDGDMEEVNEIVKKLIK